MKRKKSLATIRGIKFFKKKSEYSSKQSTFECDRENVQSNRMIHWNVIAIGVSRKMRLA